MNLRQLPDRLAGMPMLRALVPFAAGIALAEHHTLPLWLLAGAFACTGIGALLLRSQSCILALLLTTGFAGAQLRTEARTAPLELHTSYCLRIEGIPADRGGYTAAEAAVTAWRDPTDGTWHPSGDRILLSADSLTPIDAGERLCCRGRIRPLRGGTESYRKLMARRGVIGRLWIDSTRILERFGPGNSLHLLASRRMERLGLTGDADAVARAMTAGDRSGIGPELRAAYSRSGFAHLLAVSGLHTGLVFALANFVLWWLPLFRRGHLVRNLLVTAAVWLFAAAAGFPPSAVRAAVMCTLLQTAAASGSEYAGLNALAAAAFGMLLWNPAWLGDIGFRLSFLAVGGILAWGVPLCRRLHTRHRAADALIDTLVISFTASLATAPLIAHTFGIVPLVGILLNPPAILLAAIVVFGGVVWLAVPLPLLALPAGRVVESAAEALNALTRFTASIPGGTIDCAPGAGATAAAYLLFALATLILWSAEPKKSVPLRR